jgi:cytochrome P450
MILVINLKIRERYATAFRGDLFHAPRDFHGKSRQVHAVSQRFQYGLFPDAFSEWHPVVLHKTLLDAVARVSSRLFLGDRLCRDAEWLRITTTYTSYVIIAVKEYNQYPALIRPFIGRFLPSVRELLRQVQKADKLMGAVLQEREALDAAGKKPDYTDAIEWFKQTAKGRKYNPVYVQLTLSFVAIHTTADMITQVMFDLALNPEYIEPLREEVLRVLRTHGWKKTSLYNMKLLDSILKETQRLRPINHSKFISLLVLARHEC